MRTSASLLLVLALVACGGPAATPQPTCPTEPPTTVSAQATLADAALATVSVSGAVEGEFEIALRGDVALLATANFVALARCGFYDGIKFHRVLSGFVVQAGDPQTRDRDGDFDGLGRGGPGYGFEIEPPPDDLPFDRYTVAMANDQVANGSQWFVTLDDLDGALRRVGIYTIFGAVVTGTDVIDAIAEVPVNDPQMGVPLASITIERIEITGDEAASSGS
jgi:dolichyl-diphosphooligosaccharide--protein glycosyltransferase